MQRQGVGFVAQILAGSIGLELGREQSRHAQRGDGRRMLLLFQPTGSVRDALPQQASTAASSGSSVSGRRMAIAPTATHVQPGITTSGRASKPTGPSSSIISGEPARPAAQAKSHHQSHSFKATNGGALAQHVARVAIDHGKAAGEPPRKLGLQLKRSAHGSASEHSAAERVGGGWMFAKVAISWRILRLVPLQEPRNEAARKARLREIPRITS